MSLVVVDVEADGPYPGDYSMVSLGAVIVDESLDKTFYGKTKPISNLWVKEALQVSGHSREEHLSFDDPQIVMIDFKRWLSEYGHKKVVFISDNLAFDWQWVNWYFHKYTGSNPFGYSGRRIGDFYAGLSKDFYAANKWKSLRKTKHSHHPVDDAKGNAEAILEICRQFNIAL